MLDIIYKILKKVSSKRKYSGEYFSQEGEDIILERLFQGKKEGYYIDIGAHHPMRFSNTYKFYLMGWEGINVDAMPGSMKLFDRLRPRDKNLEMPLSDTKESLNYFIFNEKALNTFSESEANKKDNVNGFRIVDVIKMETFTLKDLLDQNLAKDQNIDFLSIDIEGYDFKVLNSNDWEKFRPTIVLVEELDSDIENSFKGELYLLMHKNDYRLIARTFNTSFYKDVRIDRG
ncbi:MAG: FkbM family methyltransferase [Bacteroidota bacterium]